MKIIKQLNDTDFIIRINNEKVNDRIDIVHDYIAFESQQSLWTDPKEMSESIKHTITDGCANTISVPMRVQIGIRPFCKIMLPLLLSHKYIQPNHLEDREYEEDDKYFIQNNLTEPRYKKGDKYAPYSYFDKVVIYYSKSTNTQMVAIILKGEREASHVTLEFYNKFIKSNLNK